MARRPILTREKTRLSRTELFEKVWSTPVRTLAKEYGISDVGLSKLCRRHEIPRPGLGYWARIQFGQKPPKPALPLPTNPALEAIEIIRSDPRPSRRIDPLDVPNIEVRQDRPITHPVALRIDKSILRSKKDERGLLQPSSGCIVPLHVTEGTLQRGVRILDALFHGLEQRRHTIEWIKPFDKPLAVIVENERIYLSVIEIVKRTDHKPTAAEANKKPYSWYGPRWDYSATGDLKLEAVSSEFGIRQSWSDGKRQRLESLVGEMVIRCERAAPIVKIKRAESEERHRKWEEERKRSEQAAARQAEYERKSKIVKRLCENWRESKVIAEFAKEMQTRVSASDISEKLRKELDEVIDWTLRHADYVNPLTDLEWTLRQFKNPEWMYDD